MKFFVSDFHFGTTGRSDFSALSDFESFCRKNLSNGDELYILGDFFDFWIEYKYFVPKKFVEIYKVLLNTKNQGVKISVIRGNHDFIRGKFFENLGISVFNKEINFKQNGKNVLCIHGDGISGNFFYSFIKFILTNSFFQFLYKLLPSVFAVRFAETMSDLSRKKNKFEITGEAKKEKYQKHAFSFADRKNCDILIMGHSHISDLASKNNKIYANSGVWFKEPTYVVLEENKILLKEFRKNGEKDIILAEKEV